MQSLLKHNFIVNGKSGESEEDRVDYKVAATQLGRVSKHAPGSAADNKEETPICSARPCVRTCVRRGRKHGTAYIFVYLYWCILPEEVRKVAGWYFSTGGIS